MSKTKKKEKAKINNRENNDIDYNNSTTYKGIRRDIQYCYFNSYLVSNVM